MNFSESIKDGAEQLAGLVKAQGVRRAYRDAFTTEPGKIVLRDLVKTYCTTPTYTPDPIAMAHREGKRTVILQIAKTVFGRDDLAELITQLQEEEQ